MKNFIKFKQIGELKKDTSKDYKTFINKCSED